MKNNPIRKVMVVAAVLIAVVMMMVSVYFKDISSQLFEERSQHLIEFTDKVAEVIERAGDVAWAQVDACRHVVLRTPVDTVEGLIQELEDTGDLVTEETAIVLTIDEDGNYYASDGVSGIWTERGLLSPGNPARTQVVAELPHISDGVYFLFLERLSSPVEIRESGRTITHVAIAIAVDSLQERMSISGFSEACYSYMIDQDGCRLYEYAYAENFISDRNVLDAIREYPIVNGGSYDDLYDVLYGGDSVALEFEYFDQETGENQNWFVANAAIQSTGWQVLLFVPSDVLGMHTNRLLEQTAYFFMMLIVVLILLFGVILWILFDAQSDKKLIVQQEKMNEELATAMEAAQSANRAKSEFLSYMSHDIRTPINGIMGMTEIALKNIGNQERVQDCLKKVRSSSNHLLNLVNDVLVMSRIESGKTEILRSPFDIRVCLENCASIIEGQFINRNLELVRDFEHITHSAVIGDELHLRQVFINILGNSVKFTPDGGMIYFHARELQSEDGMAVFRFELEDTGIGMSQEFLPHIFDSFSQEDGGTRTNYKGTGLGMSITKKFLDLMGGTVQVESTLNVGTRFIIELRLELDLEEHAHHEEEPVPDVVLKGMKVLLVEDNELNMEIAQEILEDEGIVVTTAENGQEAVELFGNRPAGAFDVILMDIMMPVMDGLTAARTIRAMDHPAAQEIPILAMTANAYDEDIRKTQEAGMNAHLSKPIEPEVLIKTLKQFYYAGE